MTTPVILGAGLAGVCAALDLAPMPLILVSPFPLGEECSSAWAQGGIAAALGDDDAPGLHAEDTRRAGAGLNDPQAVDRVTQDGAALIETLLARGAPFDRDAQGKLRLGLEAAHSRRRIVHAADATGKAVLDALIAAARATPSIRIVEKARATDLISHKGRLAGVMIQSQGGTRAIAADAVILATGGAAALWRETTNPLGNWGSGLALAARAGATLADLEFVQFHPTAIDIGQDPMPLASEALRGEGAILTDERGERFVDELQPRDIVARAIWAKIAQGHRVYLDARDALGPAFATRFPTIAALCKAAGLAPETMPIPVRPAAHYHMGGVKTGLNGRTDIPGLWACGEVACTGLHGANRLASNSLLEAASFARRIAEDIQGAKTPTPPAGLTPPLPRPPERAAASLRAIMSEHVGVIRNRQGLERAAAALASQAPGSDRALAAWLIAQAALKREESLGAHSRTDFPALSGPPRRSLTKIRSLSPEGVTCETSHI